MVTWREDVETAVKAIGGQGTLDQIYDEVRQKATRTLPLNWRAIIRRELEYNSSDSESYKGRHNLFYSVKGIGAGVWGLRSSENKSPIADDINAPPPDRVLVETYRILRDTAMARRIKRIHNNMCQICGNTLILNNGAGYSEAHHIRPLGTPHNGPDVAENILVLCPNHHAECDYGVTVLSVATIRVKASHRISQKFIDYHNDTIRKLWLKN